MLWQEQPWARMIPDSTRFSSQHCCYRDLIFPQPNPADAQIFKRGFPLIRNQFRVSVLVSAFR